MKTYCKRLVVSDAQKIHDSITLYMHDKYRKGNSVRFFANYMGVSKNYVRENFRPRSDFWEKAHKKLSEDMAYNIRMRTVKEHIYECSYGTPVIRYRKIKDKGSGKDRELGLESMIFRFYEVVIGDASSPLFRAKIGEYQCSSIKKRGQNYGKKAVIKWISGDAEGTKYSAKADIQKCYPSMQHEKILHLLRRDLRKSEDLLYLYDTIFKLYQEWPSPEAFAPDVGILIGSPVSKDICNYFLSYAYHYASECLVKTVCRRGQTKTKRLIKHVIFYADDIVMFGPNKKDMRTAIDMMICYMHDFLGMKIKPDWVISKTMFQDRNGNTKGGLIDYMGFRFHGGAAIKKNYFGRVKNYRKTWATIRKKIFLTARRKIALLSKRLKRHIKIRRSFAMGVISSFGWYKNTDMYRYRKKRCIDKIMRVARKIVSDYAKCKEYNEKNYYKMWRKYYVCSK